MITVVHDGREAESNGEDLSNKKEGMRCMFKIERIFGRELCLHGNPVAMAEYGSEISLL